MPSSDRSVITSDKAPKAIGPYSQAVRAGDMLFLSGQIPLDPVSGEIVGETAAEQTVRVLENIKAVLESAGAGFENIAKTTIFLVDLAAFQEVNEVYSKYFPIEPPARSTIQVAALPKGAKVEIEVTAVIK